MGQVPSSEEVSMTNVDTDDSLKTSSDYITSTPQNSKDHLTSEEELFISETTNLEIENFQDCEILKGTSNSISNVFTNLNNKLEVLDLQNIKLSLAKEEVAIVNTLDKKFEEVKIIEKRVENDTATNTNITQVQFLNKETNLNKQDSDCVCLPSKELVNALKKEILKEMPLFSKEPLAVKTKEKSLKICCSPTEQTHSSSTCSNKSLEKGTVSENNTGQCQKMCTKIEDQSGNQENFPEVSTELEKTSKENLVRNRRATWKPLKCRSWNATNDRAGPGEFTSKVKSSSDSKGRRSETLSLEHTCESSRDTSSINSKIHRDSLTMSKMAKLQEVSKCCRSKDVPISSKNDNSIDHKCQTEQNEVFFDCQSTCSFKDAILQPTTPHKKYSNPEVPPGKKLDRKCSPQFSSSSSRSQNRFRDQRASLNTSKVSELSDGSPTRSAEWSSCASSEFKLQEKKFASEKSSLSFTIPHNNALHWSTSKYRKIPSPDSSIEYLQEKISSLLVDDKNMDIVMEMAKLTERNLELESQLSQKEMRIDKLAQRSESVIERCDEIEVGLVSNLVITDERISKLSRVMDVAKRFQLENNILWNQIDKLRDMLTEKDREISRLLFLKNSEAKKEEIKTLKEKLSHLEHEHATLSLNLRKSEKLCRQYEKDLEGLEKSLKFAEDRLRLTFLDLKGIVRTKVSKRKSDSGTFPEKEIEKAILKQCKESEKENQKKDAKGVFAEQVKEKEKENRKKDAKDENEVTTKTKEKEKENRKKDAKDKNEVPTKTKEKEKENRKKDAKDENEVPTKTKDKEKENRKKDAKDKNEVPTKTKEKEKENRKKDAKDENEVPTKIKEKENGTAQNLKTSKSQVRKKPQD